MQKVTIFTDGSCLGNPGPGGWAAIVRTDQKEIELHGGTAHTTNNRMEIMAVIQALQYVHAHQLTTLPITVYLDSSLVVQTLKNGWKKRVNLELWRELDVFLKGLHIQWTWVRGHAGHPENERCDRLANAEALAYAKKNHQKVSSTDKKVPEHVSILCPSCQKMITPLLSLLPDSGHIRADCFQCGRYLKFIQPSPHAYEKARQRVLLTKQELHDLVRAKQTRGETVGAKELQKLKNCTRSEAREYLGGIQESLF